MRKRGLPEKTIRNTIDGSLRAMVRDAEQEGVAVSFLFGKVRWPDKVVPGSPPFSEAERDQILNYFRGERWRAGGFSDTRPHYPYFAFLYTLFFTGMRLSELVVLRVGSVNLRARTLQVERSRHLGSDAAPKTQRARRTVRLTRSNVEVLESLVELKARPHDYFFKNIWGDPTESANFLRSVSRRATRALDLAAARSLLGESYLHLTRIDQRCERDLVVRTDRRRLSTILKHYGRVIHSSQANDLEMSKIEIVKPLKKVQFGHRFGHPKGVRKKVP
jgi:integrase